MNQLTAQPQYKNQYPLLFLHPFLPLLPEDSFTMYPNYSGHTKYNLKQQLTKLPYPLHQPNLPPFTTNYHRPVQFYYYIKPRRLHYPPPHPPKYPHHRYRKTYPPPYKHSNPPQKIHLIPHTIPPQTIPYLQHLLPHATPQQVQYHKQHPPDISPLYKPRQHNIISSITTIPTPHNRTHPAHLL
ncbi:lipase-like domain-containing protein, partial [Staphylococcus epidermidis]